MNFNLSTATYESAYAHFAPIFRARWNGQPESKLIFAQADVLETLKLHPERSAYAGKLYAELDAIREATRDDKVYVDIRANRLTDGSYTFDVVIRQQKQEIVLAACTHSDATALRNVLVKSIRDCTNEIVRG